MPASIIILCCFASTTNFIIATLIKQKLFTNLVPEVVTYGDNVNILYVSFKLL